MATTSIQLRGIKYPVHIEGQGVPSLCIGIGSLTQRTLSDHFKRHFKVYATDTYWIEKNKVADPTSFTMQQIVDDVIDGANQLNLESPLLIAHSCFGIVALEVAKQKPQPFSGVLLIASPPCWNPESIAFARDHFDRHASEERKSNDRARQAAYLQKKTPQDSCLNLNVYEADIARYWSNFHITRAELEELWDGIEVDDGLGLHFYDTLLPAHTLLSLDKISLPVLLAAGRQDYDSVPLELWKQFPKPPLFTILDCGDGCGHWPQIESQPLFDEAVIAHFAQKVSKH